MTLACFVLDGCHISTPISSWHLDPAGQEAEELHRQHKVSEVNPVDLDSVVLDRLG